MKTPEYTEGPKAVENFESMATAVFKVPKAEVAKVETRSEFAPICAKAKWSAKAG
jgi:hypothetical protein